MSPYHAKALRAFSEGAPGGAKEEILHLRERFAPDTPDLEWMRVLGKEGGWVIVSGDTRITRNPIEQAAWHESGLTAFFFVEAFPNMSGWKQAATLVTWWPTLTKQARATPKGYGFTVPKLTKSGLRQIYP
jgi:PIN like domain